MKTRFRIHTTKLKGTEFETDREEITVGRSSANDLVLRQKSVSRSHARISCRDGRLYVEDLDSKNATMLGGDRVDGPREVQDGDFLSFGDVLVQVRFGEQAGEDDDEATPVAEVPAVGRYGQPDPGGWQADAQPAGLPGEWTGGEVSGEAAVRQEAAAGRDPVMQMLILLLGLTLIGLLGVYFITRSGGPEPVESFGMTVRVGQSKVVQVPRGFVRSPRIEDERILKVERAMNLDRAMLLVGRSEGNTAVELYDDAGQFVELRTRVLPARESDIERELAERSLGDRQRVRLAREQLKLGDELEKQSEFYRARECYDRALALLEPFAENPNTLYLQARRRRDRTREKIEQEWDRLTRQMSDFIKQGDKRTALKRLQQARELIPDPQDVRRQNADLLYRLLKDVIESEQKAEGRFR